MKPYFVAGFFLALFAVTADSRWGVGGCEPTEPQRSLQPAIVTSKITTTPDGYSWYKRSDKPNELYLFRDGRQLGTWNIAEEYFLPIVGDAWGERQAGAPVPPPGVNWRLNGVERKKLDEDSPTCRWTINGEPVSVIEAASALLEDDSAKLWLVVSGEGREKFLTDAKADPKLADLLSRTRVWSVPADHFSLKDRDTGKVMFPVGSPGVLLAAADGTELYRQVGYQGPQDLEALRKADPNLKPDTPSPVGPSNPWNAVGIVLAALAVLYFLTRGKDK